MKFGDQGTAVLEVQEAVIAKGYDLPRYGADGHASGGVLGVQTFICY